MQREWRITVNIVDDNDGNIGEQTIAQAYSCS